MKQKLLGPKEIENVRFEKKFVRGTTSDCLLRKGPLLR